LEVEVLIPHVDRAESLRRTLLSLRAQTVPADVCVIDNGSSDGTDRMLENEFPDVRVLRLGSNHGFGAAINRGANTSGADLLVLVNNDAVADSHFLEELQREHEQSGAEMIAACMRQKSGPIESLGIEVDRSLIAYDLGYGQPYPDFPAAARVNPIGPSGGAAAFERSAFVSLGGFDEAIFAYLEDLDLALRARTAGMGCALAWRAFVLHEHSATLGSGSAQKNFLMGRSRGYILWKHGRSLRLDDRIRGLVMDGVVYAGQALMDRNAQAVRGRLDLRGEVRTQARPVSPALDRHLFVQRSLVGGLGLRRARRL
jgi:GT2 family glycosyltransferase